MSIPQADAAPSPRLITEAEWRAHAAAARDRLPALAAAGISHHELLLGYQRRLLEATAENPVTVVEKSRRIGATWGIGADAVLTAAATRAGGGMDAFYIGYNLDMAREFIDVCAMWARAFDQAVTEGGIAEFLFADGPDRNIQAFRIRFASGFEIVALASRPRSLRGRQGYVIVDEAAFHDDLDALLQAALALLIWGGRVLILSTHLGQDNPFNRLVEEVRAKRKPYALLRVTFDDALLDGLYRRICVVKGDPWSEAAEAAWRTSIIGFYGEAADEELYCIPSEGGGAWLPSVLVEARAAEGIPVLRLERNAAFTLLPPEVRQRDVADWCARELAPRLAALDPRTPACLGEDFGRVADLTVLWPLQVTPTLRRLTPFVVELRTIPYDQQEQVVFFLLDRLPRFFHAKFDATGNGGSLAEKTMQRYGPARVECVRLSPTWYLENTAPLKAAFEDGTIVIPRDREIAGDLKLVRTRGGIPYIPDARTKVGEHKTRHGDAAVALMLAHAASYAVPIEYAYVPVSRLDSDPAFAAPLFDDQDGRVLW